VGLAEGEWLSGACLIVLAGFFDILDGAMPGTVTRLARLVHS